jgi:hypothetical protein
MRVCLSSSVQDPLYYASTIKNCTQIQHPLSFLLLQQRSRVNAVCIYLLLFKILNYAPYSEELQTSDPALYTALHRKNIIKKVVCIFLLFKILDVPSLSLVPSPRTTNSLTEAREQDSTFFSIDKLNIQRCNCISERTSESKMSVALLQSNEFRQLMEMSRDDFRCENGDRPRTGRSSRNDRSFLLSVTMQLMGQ